MKELLARLESSEEFKKFKQEYPDAYLCTAFFVLGRPEEEKHQLNYAISDSEVMSFDITKDKISPVKLKTVKTEISEPINLEEVKISQEKAKENVEKHANKKFSKAIVVLQRLKGKTVWNVTCIEGFSINRFHVSAEDGKIQDLKSFNIRDMMRAEKKDPATGQRVEMKLPEKPSEPKTPPSIKESKEVPKEEATSVEENHVHTNKTPTPSEEPKSD